MRKCIAALIAVVTVVAGAHALAAGSKMRIDLTGRTVEIPLTSPIVAGQIPRRCFVVIEGLTALRPVGTSYTLSVAARGETARSVGAISFFDAIGLPLEAHGPLSFELPARYCTAQGVVARLRPVSRPNPLARPAIGRLILRVE